MIADGVPPYQAIQAVGATRALVEGMLRSSAERLRQWNEARMAAERRHWDMDIITEICNEIAAGLSVHSACKKRGKPPESFVKLVLLDPGIREEYDLARKVRAELWADESIEIADEEHNDLDLAGRGNMAAVKRSDLRVTTRRRLMEDFNKDRFSPGGKKNEVNVQVNINAAERLEAARQRRNALRVQDAEFKEVSLAPHEAGVSPMVAPDEQSVAQGSGAGTEDWLQ